MRIPYLIDVLYADILDEYYEEVSKEDNCPFLKDLNKEKEKLEEQLNEEQKNLLKRYTCTLENKLEYINYRLNTLILNIGIKFGMDIQKAFDQES